MAAHDEKPVAVPTKATQSAGSARALDALRSKKRKRAMKIVRRYMLLSGGMGLIPAPFLDQVVLGGVLAKMIYDLCGHYGVSMTEHKAKTITAAVLGGAHAEWISRYLLKYSQKYLPGSTGIGRIVTRPVISAAITYSVGLLFVHHFDKGAWGTRQWISKPASGSLPSPQPAATD
jgi:uncharacterized protein (DUF697 family)